MLADIACRNAGKRLCTAEEWRTACRGERNTRYPYGTEYEQGTCNVYQGVHPAVILYGLTAGGLDDPRLNQVGFQGRELLHTTGSHERCKSPWGSDGVFDMVGNLDEWVDDPHVVFLGGFYSRDTPEGCDYRNDHHEEAGPSYFNYSIGFRCCDSLRP